MMSVAQVLNQVLCPLATRIGVDLVAVEVEVEAGAVGFPDGQASTGVDLMVWEAGRWQRVASWDGGWDPEADAPRLSSGDWTVEDPVRVGRLPAGPSGDLGLALLPYRRRRDERSRPRPGEDGRARPRTGADGRPDLQRA